MLHDTCMSKMKNENYKLNGQKVVQNLGFSNKAYYVIIP